MRKNGLNARKRRNYIPATNSNHGLPVCENLRERRFTAVSSGAKGVSDITYLRTSGGWIYLTILLDRYDRTVIGWAMSADMETAHTTVAALERARKNPPPGGGLLFHADRGVQ